MKKTLKLLTVFFAVFSAAIFSSCNDVIFDTIREEVKLSDAQISGDIYALVRHTAADGDEYLYASLGTIWKKNINSAATGTPTTQGPYSDNWVKSPSPSNLLTSLISNSAGELYALSLKWETFDDDGENEPVDWTLYWSDDDGATWKTAAYDDSSEGTDVVISAGSYNQTTCVFGTNTPKKANRAAFANFNGNIYSLAGGKAVKIYSSDVTPAAQYVDISENSKNVVTFDGSTFYFVSTFAATTNETYTNDATVVYKASGNRIYYKTTNDGAAFDSTYVDVSDIGTTRSIAYAADCLLTGTTSGLEIVNIDETTKVPLNSTGSSLANTSSTLSSYYEIWKVLVVDPSLKAAEGDLYGTTDFDGSSSSTSATFQNVGLWAYYPGRAKWNRE